MSFDFAVLDVASLADEGVDMPVPHPKTGAPMLDSDDRLVTIRVHGQHSQAVREARRKIQQRRLEATKRGQTDYTPEDRERDDLDVLAAAVSGWSFDTLDGQPFPYSEANVRKLLGDRRFANSKGAIAEFLNQDGHFMKG